MAEETNSSDDSGNLAKALSRLNDALDSLEKQADKALESSGIVHSADEEVQRMADDRVKLARELDSARSHSEKLKETNSEVSKRLVGAMEMVRGVLDKSR